MSIERYLKNRKYILFSILIFLFIFFYKIFSSSNDFSVTIVTTTDVHGAIFPYDSVKDKDTDYSISHVSHLLKELRHIKNNEVIYLDSGDFYQGDPIMYYYNNIAKGKNIGSQICNYLCLSAMTVGNHEFDLGSSVYNKISKDMKAPFLAANIIDKNTGKPYFSPYVIVKKRGFKIAILGMTTPEITFTHPKHLWSEMLFEDIIESSKKWIGIIKEVEKPDFIVGLFHTGLGTENHPAPFSAQHLSLRTALSVDGFDIIFKGHDHKSCLQHVTSQSGKDVIVLGGSASTRQISQVIMNIQKDKNRYSVKSIQPKLITFDGYNLPKDNAFLMKFHKAHKIALEYLNTSIATLKKPISFKNALFGPSTGIDFIHQVQFDVSKKKCGIVADLSFVAPRLLIDLPIELRIKDLFGLYYPPENWLCIVQMTGEEIRLLLEFFFTGWFATIKDQDSYLLDYLLDSSTLYPNKNTLVGGYTMQKLFLFCYNAAGIDFSVDVQKSTGERVKINKLSSGELFISTKLYNVVLSSILVNGGCGNPLVNGAKIPESEIANRTIMISETNFFEFFMEYIIENKNIDVDLYNNWKLIPLDLTKKLAKKEYNRWFCLF